MRWFSKIIKAPSGETVDLQGIQTWIVEWFGRHGEFSMDTSKCAQAFTSKEDAEHFASELRKAFSLIRHSGPGTHVSVIKQ